MVLSEELSVLPVSVPEGDGAMIPPGPDADVMDLRFRALVGEEAWARLPVRVRRRFSKRLAEGEIIVYRGHVSETVLSTAGWVLAQLARLIGGPLPFTAGATGGAVVVVTEDRALRGQAWTRTYARAGRFPQVVHSAKRFCGPTGLEEYVGAGIGMTLAVSVVGEALHFRSQQYFLGIGGWRLYLPRFLEPGAMEIVHTDLAGVPGAGGDFSFRLSLIHPLAGSLLNQLAIFHDP
jgi:Domain of unknown function (DUF4166)